MLLQSWKLLAMSNNIAAPSAHCKCSGFECAPQRTTKTYISKDNKKNDTIINPGLKLINKPIISEKGGWYICKTCSHSERTTTVSFVGKNQSLVGYQILLQKRRHLLRWKQRHSTKWQASGAGFQRHEGHLDTSVRSLLDLRAFEKFSSLALWGFS